MKKNIDEKTTTTNTPDTPNEEKEILGVDNDVRVIIQSKTDGVLFDQECCTTINIILNNDAQIATSFLGIHNESIIKSMEKAIKIYFKSLKKTLKEERKRAKEIIDTEDDSQTSTTDEQATNDDSPKTAKDTIHHIKEFTPQNPDDSNLDEAYTKKDSTDTSKDSSDQPNTTANSSTKEPKSDNNIKQEQSGNNSAKVVQSDTPAYEHICDENGCRLVKKRLDPKTGPNDELQPKTQTKQTNTKTKRLK